MTESARVNSATEPEYSAGRSPGLPCSTQMAVELSSVLFLIKNESRLIC